MRFSCPGLTLKLEIVKWIKDRSGSPYDSWITCQVHVMVPGFTGNFTCDLLEIDFTRFYRELEEMNKKVGKEMKAHLTGMEPGIDLELVSTKKGTILGSYVFDNFLATDYMPKLTGRFDLDQTYLAPFMEGVQELLANPSL